ncbi:MAG: hypothetical protein JNL92_18350 [Opitutaceae bacterium]|nr:hypothetical protein [Opitutaceae bacterium]
MNEIDATHEHSSGQKSRFFVIHRAAGKLAAKATSDRGNSGANQTNLIH